MTDVIVYKKVNANLPPTWTRPISISNTQMRIIDVPIGTNEFNIVQNYFATTVRSVKRHENINQYGMYAIRQQQLQALHPAQKYSKVKRFCKVTSTNVDKALKFNLDTRKLDIDVTFRTDGNSFGIHHGTVIFVMNFTVKEEERGRLTPDHDNDKYIDYVVYF